MDRPKDNGEIGEFEMKLITIGDNVVDCYLDQRKYYPGGNCVNVAVNMKRNGAEKSAYIGVFATDDKALAIQESLAKENVDYLLSRTVEGISGQPRVNLTEHGDRVFVGGPKNTVQHNMKLKLTDDDLAYVSSFDLCHVSCYSSMEEELHKLRDIIKVSFDFSNIIEAQYFRKVCPNIHNAFISGAHLTDDEINQLLSDLEQYELEVIGVTRGEKPAIFSVNGEIYTQAPLETEVVDTMGAGDSFISGFLYQYYSGHSVTDSLLFAAECAKRTCSFYGGYGYPQHLKEEN